MRQYIEEALGDGQVLFAQFLFALQGYLLTVAHDQQENILKYITKIIKSKFQPHDKIETQQIQQYLKEAPELPKQCRRYVYFDKEQRLKSIVICEDQVVGNEIVDF